MKKILSILLLLFPVCAFAVDSITLTELPARVYQRNLPVDEYGVVSLSGTYTGTAPTHIEARAVLHGTSTEVKTWTTLSSETISGGGWSGTLSSIPQGGWYNVQVRESNATEIVDNGSTAWGVGILIFVFGQSNSLWLAESCCNGDSYCWGGSNYTPNTLLRQYPIAGGCFGGFTGNSPATGAWTNPTADGVVKLGNGLLASIGNVPIGFINYNLSGSVLLADSDIFFSGWIWDADHYYTTAKNAVKALTTNIELGIWWQGYSDGVGGATQSTYYAGLQTLYTNFTTDFSGAKLVYLINDVATASVINAAINQAVTNGYGYAGADATGLTYDHSPDIGPAQGATVGERFAAAILAQDLLAISYYDFSGSITVSSSGLSGVTLDITGNDYSDSVESDVNGDYAFEDLPGWAYTITPSKVGYIFNPTSVSINYLTDLDAIDFDAIPLLGGVTISVTGDASCSTVTASDGTWSCTGLDNNAGNVTITPSKEGYTFDPTERNVSLKTTNISNLNFYYTESTDETAPSVTISTDDPSTVNTNSKAIAGTASDDGGVSQCKWRLGSAPDNSNGTALTGTTSWSGTVTGLTLGANSVYVGCKDPTGNWGSDSMVINYETPSEIYIPLSGVTGIGIILYK